MSLKTWMQEHVWRPLLNLAYRKLDARGSLADDREELGQLVREEWVTWAYQQPSPKASWLVGWDALGEADKEVDRRIGVRLAMEGMNRVRRPK